MPTDLPNLTDEELALFRFLHNCTLKEIRDYFVSAAMARYRGDKTRVATHLGVSLKTVYNMLSREAA